MLELVKKEESFMNILKKYNRTKKILETHQNRLRNLKEKENEETRVLSNKYYDLERALEEKKYKEQNEIVQKYSDLTLQLQNSVKSQEDTWNYIQDTLKYMDVYVDHRDLLFCVPAPLLITHEWDNDSDKEEFLRKIRTGDPHLSDPKFHSKPSLTYSYLPNHCIDIIKDKYKHIAVSIQFINNPKNKYALYFHIKSMFRVMIFNSTVLKTAPTEEELLKYYEKIKSKIVLKTYKESYKLSDIIKDLDNQAQKYEEAVTLLKTNPDWKHIYLIHRKKYYENCVSQGTDSEEYKQICLLLQKLERNL
jgi:hypothetical protein